jgi:hypothetical protein
MTFRRSPRWHRLALLFSGLLLFSVFTQLGVAWYERQHAVRSNLRKDVEKILREVRYSNAWDLTRLRQADLTVGSYYILDRSGLVIDTFQFIPDLGFQAVVADFQPGLRTTRQTRTNETWRLLVRPLAGGWLILGVSPPANYTRIDERLQENAGLFGDSLEKAATVSPSEVDRDLEYALLDTRGNIRFLLGSIPLTLRQYPQLPVGEATVLHTPIGTTYIGLSAPFLDAIGATVGTITVLQELPLAPWFSFRVWLANLSSSFALAFLGTLIGSRFLPDRFHPCELLGMALKNGESSTVEFKQALRWDAWSGAPPGPSTARAIAEGIAIKTVAGFLKSLLGGALFIGISDDKSIVGLARDYESLTKPGDNASNRAKDSDRFQLHLRQLLASRIGRDVCNLCVEVAITARDGKDVCVVRARPAPAPVYVTETKGKVFYVREGASTVELNVEQTVKYCQARWPRTLLARLRRSIQPS